MLASIRHILPLVTIRRERVLPIPGRVVVRNRQKVSASDVIAEARLAPQHLLLDIARGLGLSEDEADRHLHCKAGTQAAQGDVLAGPVGVTKRVVRAPQNSRVILAGGGQILLELDGSLQEIKAAIPGVVIALVGDRGAVVETSGALIQGAWGNGRIDYGLMTNLLQSPEDKLTADRLDVSLRGSILLGGYCEDAEVIKTAAGLPVRGLILSSMSADLIPIAEKVRFPILVLEGFGPIALNSSAYNLLTTSERRDVAVIAEPWDQYRGARPEVIIPLPASGELPQPQETDTYAVGQTVCLIRNPKRGHIGKIAEIYPGLTVLPSGVKALAADVRLESGEKVIVPLANLEVVE